MARTFHAVRLCNGHCDSSLPAIGDCADDNLFDCEVVSGAKEKIRYFLADNANFRR